MTFITDNPDAFSKSDLVQEVKRLHSHVQQIYAELEQERARSNGFIDDLYNQQRTEGEAQALERLHLKVIDKILSSR